MKASEQCPPQIALGYRGPAVWFAGCTRDQAGGAGSGYSGPIHSRGWQ